MKKKGISIGVFIVIVIAILVAVLGGGGDSNNPGGTQELSVLYELRDFLYPNYDGNLVVSDVLIGKVGVVNSWATWCPFCVDELSDFAKLQEEFPDDVVVIAINRKESAQVAKGFTDSLGISDKMFFLLDKGDSFYTRVIGGIGMPETVFVDREGNVVIHKRGPMEFNEMKEKVEQVIAFSEQQTAKEGAE